MDIGALSEIAHIEFLKMINSREQVFHALKKEK